MSFEKEIKAFVESAKKNSDLLVRKTVLDIGSRLVLRTPVGDAKYWKSKPPAGYSGGHARANWQHSTGKPKVSEVSGIDKAGGVTIANISSGVAGSEVGIDHYITNSVPYIIPLENGHSRQAPKGMVALTVLEFQGIVNGIAKGINK